MIALTLASIALYGAGVTSTLSPCVLPLVPGYLGVLTDSAGVGNYARAQRVGIFAFGAIATFVALGGAVAAVGLALSGTIGLLQRLSGLALILMAGATLAGKLGKVGPELRLVRVLPSQPHLRALVLGLGCGAAWSPCVGPLLGAALTAAGGSGSVWRGSWLLFAFGCGVLTPFVATAFLRNPFVGVRGRVIGRRLSAAAPVVMLGLGVLLIAGWYDGFVQRLMIETSS